MAGLPPLGPPSQIPGIPTQQGTPPPPSSGNGQTPPLGQDCFVKGQ